MATMSLMDAQNVQKYELALHQLGGSEPLKKQRPIVERRPPFTQQEAVAAAANALAALWNKRPERSNTGNPTPRNPTPRNPSAGNR